MRLAARLVERIDTAPPPGASDKGVLTRMNRRSFITTGSALGAASLTGCSPSPQPVAEAQKPEAKPILMHVGCQRSPTTPEMLQNFKRHGVNNICG